MVAGGAGALAGGRSAIERLWAEKGRVVPGFFTGRWMGAALLAIAGLAACGGDTPVAQPPRQLTVAPVFGSGMVLQRGMPVPVTGTAEPGATVTVGFQGRSVSTVVASGGAWRVDLPSMDASAAPGTLTIASAGAAVELTGVRVGEVWVCAGQSNMDMRLEEAAGGIDEARKASGYDLRLFRMTDGAGPAATRWTVSDPTTAPVFSAVCYWFGVELNRRLGVPVGLIQATHDGTAIAEWQTGIGGGGADYLAMVRPVQPYAIRGVAWYQGESNDGDPAYEAKLTGMIAEWRAGWGRADLPFGIVQLTGPGSAGAGEGEAAVSRKVPHTFLVVTSDLPGGDQLHPAEKKAVGVRLGIGARGAVYGEPIMPSGPVPDPAASSRAGGKAVLTFAYAGDGLIARNGGSLAGFELADSSGVFRPATAAIVAPNRVEVASAAVAAPVRVRYGYGAVGTLSSAVSIPVEGGTSAVTQLPASQFDLVLP